jgi:hypothetical protein
MQGEVRRDPRLRRVIGSPVTWWLVAFLGVVVAMMAMLLVVLGMLGAAFSCSLPHACALDAGLRFVLRMRFLLVTGLVLIVGGAVGYVWTRRSAAKDS